jgi:Na+-driven multidrug efflux pump
VRIFFIRCASPTGGVQIAAPIVLAQHKGNKRIGEARTSIRHALPIIIEIACLFC